MRIIIRLLLILIFFGIVAGVILYARGYRFDFTTKSISPTGIIATSSSPRASKVYVNGTLKGVTDLNLTLPPDKYFVEVKREGYSTWSKEITLKGELVMIVDPVLFPLNPSLSPVTNLGIVKAIPLDGTERVLLFSDTNDPLRDGIYLFDTSKRPLSFFPPLKTIVLKKNIPNSDSISLKDTNIYFSPDYKQFVAEFKYGADSSLTEDYLFNTDSENQTPFDTSQSKASILEAWNTEKIDADSKILQTYPKDIAKIASDSFHILSFSPDENKFLYIAKEPVTIPLVISPPLIAANQTAEERSVQKDKLYVYDKKEDKNFPININVSFDQSQKEKLSVTPTRPPLRLTPKKAGVSVENSPLLLADESLPILWYPDSKHLVFNENKRLSVSDYDGKNKQIVYSGPFDGSFFTATSDGKVIVLANLNPENNQFPDLYVVGIR